MNLFQQFQNFIQRENLFSAKDRLLVAASGGVDSVVLCELCAQAGYDFVMAHCNFQLRAAESEKDEAFVRALETRYNKKVLVKRFNTEQYALEQKVSIQVAARDLRYTWFNAIINERVQHDSNTAEAKPAMGGLSRLLTAHHLDDNIETLLMNFFKGTGIAGLRGILPKQGRIVRPLLFAKKYQLLQFATENQLSWREDSSNESDKYTRNYFRNQFIPLVQRVYPEADNNLAENLQRFRDIEFLYQQAIDSHKKKLLEYKAGEVHIPILKLQKAVPLLTVVYEIIKPYGFNAEQAAGVIALFNSDTGKYIDSATHRILKNRRWLIISPLNSTERTHILIEAGETTIAVDGGLLKLNIMPAPPSSIPATPAEAYLDAKEIVYPLILRKWKTGDYFYPLGMPKKKKLARFFIDQKLSKTAKEKIWVLESSKKIIWIAGYRIDDRFKITTRTKTVLHLRCSS